MKIENKDFVLVKGDNDKKPYLVEVATPMKSKIIGYLSAEERATLGDKKFKIECHTSDVVVNFGAEPPVGQTVMGLRIEPFIARVKMPPFSGSVAVLDVVPKSEMESITKAALRFKKKLAKYDALDNVRHWNVSIRPAHGTHSGMWKYSPKTGEESVQLFAGQSEDWLFTIGHEFGHHIWGRCMTPKQKALWISIHRKALKFSEIKTSKITQYRAELEKVGSVKDYRKALRSIDKDEGAEGENAELPKFDLVLKASLKMCNAKPEDFDIIMESGGSLIDYWTKTPIPQVDRNVIITEYALKSPTELFCECLGYYLCGRDMPARIRKITGRTFKKALARGFSNEQ